ncbi:cobyrinate a,c-diamide synthase [Ectothiorhodospiraceae bacterium BW-2]|nr:cobyrinate a,c-diamide synthase [Ectothiorhodospiraceae bacterium BW-2]
MQALYLAAPHKSSGKTTITIALAATLTARGSVTQLFKKGPDYIDPMWHQSASNRPGVNLDFHTLTQAEIVARFHHYSRDADFAIVEGNMGLFDSLDVAGHESNAELAKLLQTPVVLVVDAKGATRSWVAMIQGLQQFDPELKFCGLIFNNVAGERHRQRLQQVVEHYLDTPLLGALLRDPALNIDERHLGLIPSPECSQSRPIIERLISSASEQIDIDLLCEQLTDYPLPSPSPPRCHSRVAHLRIAIARDEAFNFYYTTDLDYFQRCGVELVPFSPIRDPQLPPNIDALLIGGGFPENFAAELAANRMLRHQIAAKIEAGLPTYAECGGLIYLSKSLQQSQRRDSLIGVIPASCQLHSKPVGRGYARFTPTANHPWPLARAHQQPVAAHEFHYSDIQFHSNTPKWQPAYQLQRGHGIGNRLDGYCHHNLLASYLHLQHSQNFPWIDYFIDFIQRVK